MLWILGRVRWDLLQPGINRGGWSRSHFQIYWHQTSYVIDFRKQRRGRIQQKRIEKAPGEVHLVSWRGSPRSSQLPSGQHRQTVGLLTPRLRHTEEAVVTAVRASFLRRRQSTRSSSPVVIYAEPRLDVSLTHPRRQHQHRHQSTPRQAAFQHPYLLK